MSASLKRTVTQLNNSGLTSHLSRAEAAPSRAETTQLTAKSAARFPIQTNHSSTFPSSARQLVKNVAEESIWPKKQRLSTPDFWEKYTKFMRLDQAGLATIAYYKTEPFSRCLLVAIKEHRTNEGPAQEFSPCRKSQQIVGLLNIHHDEDKIFFVYEHMEVSLRQVSSTSRPLGHIEIRAVCKEILGGLEYMHRTLQVIHGSLDCNNVLLSHDGAVKLANLGGCLLRGERATADTERKDTRALGLIMMEIMEPTTVLQDPGSLSLRHPEKWANVQDIDKFLVDTEIKNLRELQTHPFLTHQSSYSCLVPHVLIAQVSARRTWEVFS